MDRSRGKEQLENTIMKTLLSVLFILIYFTGKSQTFGGSNGTVNLKGVAPQETITAKSSSLSSTIDLTSKKFSFKQPLTLFTFSQGSLQKQHAEESYFETEKFPNATFKGEIINDVDLKADGKYHVTAKGIFSIHGVQKEIKIPAVIERKGNKIVVTSDFKIYLSDYNIKIPRLLVQKVSDEFTVSISTALSIK